MLSGFSPSTLTSFVVQRHVRYVCLIVMSLAVLSGCPEPGPGPDAEQVTTMRGLAVSYGQYISQHRGRPPKNEAALRKFIEAQGDFFLESFNLESVDDAFVSPRDGEPYVIVYGKKAKIIAYEATGVDGNRFVAHDLGAVEEVDAATFAELVPNAK